VCAFNGGARRQSRGVVGAWLIGAGEADEGHDLSPGRVVCPRTMLMTRIRANLRAGIEGRPGGRPKPGAGRGEVT